MIHSTDVYKSKRAVRSHSIISKKHSQRAKSHHYKNYRKLRRDQSKDRQRSQSQNVSIAMNSDQTFSDRNNSQTSFDEHAMIEDNLCIAIFGLLCFFPTGIFGFIRALQAHQMKKPSSALFWPKLAALYGRHALRWAVLSILIGILLVTSFIIYRLLRIQYPIWSAYYQGCIDQFLC